MKKVIIGIMCIIVILLLVFFVIKIGQKFEYKKNENNMQIETNDFKFVSEFGVLGGDLITRLTKKNGNWEGIPLSENFKKNSMKKTEC